MHLETPTYPVGAFIADVGGAAGLIFGLNVMENGFIQSCTVPTDSYKN